MLKRISLLLTIALTALDVAYAVPVNGAYRRLDGGEYTKAHKSIVRVAGPTAPVIAVPLMVTYLISLYRSRRERGLILASLVCLVANAAITLVVNVPINDEFMRSSDDSPPENWKYLRKRWIFAHNVRTAAQVVGLISTVFWTSKPDTTERK